MQLLPTEHDEAVLLASYLELLQKTGKILLYSHVPNETFTKSWKTKKKNKEEGVKSGVPDYIIVTGDRVIFLELKRPKNSATSAEQKQWLLHLQGKTTVTFLAKGFDAAKANIESHL